MLSRRTCVNNPDSLCFICGELGGEYMFQDYLLNVSDFVKLAYMDYFWKPLDINSKPWIRNMMCKSCVSLRLCPNIKRPTFKYKRAMIKLAR